MCPRPQRLSVPGRSPHNLPRQEEAFIGQPRHTFGWFALRLDMPPAPVNAAEGAQSGSDSELSIQNWVARSSLVGRQHFGEVISHR